MLRNWLIFYLQCWRPYRYRQTPAGLSDFVIPTFNAAFFVRLVTLIIVSYIVFGIFMIPTYIKGGSMEPERQACIRSLRSAPDAGVFHFCAQFAAFGNREVRACRGLARPLRLRACRHLQDGVVGRAVHAQKQARA